MIICYFKLRHKQAWFFGAWNNMYALRRPCFMQAGIGKHVTSHETHTWLERWDPKLNSITQTSFGAGLFPLHLQTEILSCICFDFPISEEISLSWLCVGSFRELHGSFVLLLSLLLYPACRGTQGELVFSPLLYKSMPRARGNLWGFLMTACLVSPSRCHKEHFKVLGSKTFTA